MAGVGEAACFLCVLKVAELEVSISIALPEFAKQFCLRSNGSVLFWASRRTIPRVIRLC
ncbi:hypothetical protein-transmembrane prediction [Rhodopirellula baltica SH 1]|uniref:Uncharacterized protein n=1 Tax=Rhodopirellula baltica (strain DSM 10527 / NCIMB 13988 / SH1) TaxID=243090 RepID=Q7UWW2_RHOBA|nr:hypothetical protein-transmembrane prediction [Rhodopirellula baltica SH 1]